MVSIQKVRRAVEVLGLQRGATLATTKQKYLRLVKTWHPDAAGGCSHRFVEVKEAYDVLQEYF